MNLFFFSPGGCGTGEMYRLKVLNYAGLELKFIPWCVQFIMKRRTIVVYYVLIERFKLFFLRKVLN